MIGFLLPKLVWFGLLALLPIAIHLLNRIRLRRVEFSSLMFLRDVKRERFNWLRLKEILLLIARTALLLFLFLGLSRPFLKKGWFGAKRELSAVLILDDSYSMRYGSAAERAVAAARGYLSQLTGNSEVALLTSTRPRAGYLTRNQKQFSAQLDSITVTYADADLAAAVEQARELLSRAVLPQREIVVFTDLQKRALAPVAPNDDQRVAVLVKDCGTADWRNCAVISVSPQEHLPEPDRPTGLLARVRNFGPTEETRKVFMTADGITESRTVTIPAGDERTVEFERQLTEAGQHTGSVSLDPDSLPADDRRFFVVNIPSRVPVLVVGDTPEDTFYVARALAPESTGFFRVTTRLSDNLRTADLRRFRVVALINPAGLTSFDWQRVEDYLRQGGAVFMALGDEPRNRDALGRFGTFVSAAQPSGFVTIEKADYDHPILETFRGRTDISLPRFYRYSRIAAGNAAVLARFSDGSPYLLESRTDRALLAASDFRLADNDLVFRALFVPLLHRTFSYLAQEGTRREYSVGDTITVPAPQIGLLKVRTPEGEFNIAPANPARFGGTAEPGIYELDGRAFSVNVNPDESDLTRMSESDLARKQMALLPDVRGKMSDLTNSFLLIAALCLVAEMLILLI
jgi:hypothetical protein